MYKRIKLALANRDESEEENLKEFGFLACASTGMYYKRIFGTELMGDISKVIAIINESEKANAAANSGQIDANTYVALMQSGVEGALSQLAYIMNHQAEGAKMATLNIDDYYEWLDQFESLEFLNHGNEFLNLYIGNTRGTSTPKKEIAQSTGK